MYKEHHFPFWVRYLKISSIIFAGFGVFWAVAGTFDPFGIYENAFADAFWNQEALPTDARQTFRFILGPFGATTAGYFILQYFIAANAFAKREPWAYYGIIGAFLFWLVLDSLISAYHSAYFNILFANIPSLIVMFPVFFTKKYFKPTA